jgi:hypothetical protein
MKSGNTTDRNSTLPPEKAVTTDARPKYTKLTKIKKPKTTSHLGLFFFIIIEFITMLIRI